MAVVPAFGWVRTGSMPFLSGGFSVGCIELEIPSPTSVGACPVLVFYPSIDDVRKLERPPWLTADQCEALGRAQLAELFGEGLASIMMRHLGPLATGLLRIPAAPGLQPAALPASRESEGWPVAVISHGLTGWPTVQTALAASLCSHGAVVLLICHCDGSACVGRSAHSAAAAASDANHYNGGPTQKPVDVPYQDWTARARSLRSAGVSENALQADGEAWRRQQNEQRVTEVHAVLDGLNDALGAADPHLFGDAKSFHARTEREVALFGHSFGGATVAACLLRDGTPRVVGGVNTIYSNGTGSRSSSSPADVQSSEPLRPAARFSHGFLFDPWIGGFACPLAEAELRARKLTSSLVTLRVWLNEGSFVARNATGPAEALIEKAKAANTGKCLRTADILWVGSSSHYAQTDVPTVFENGPLACIYAAIKGPPNQYKGGPMLTAREALRYSISEALEPLLESQWLAVGLSPIGG